MGFSESKEMTLQSGGGINSSNTYQEAVQLVFSPTNQIIANTTMGLCSVRACECTLTVSYAGTLSRDVGFASHDILQINATA